MLCRILYSIVIIYMEAVADQLPRLGESVYYCLLVIM